MKPKEEEESCEKESVHAHGPMCDFFGPDYINACGVDAAGDLLRLLLDDTSPGGAGPLTPPSASQPPLQTFYQSPKELHTPRHSIAITESFYRTANLIAAI